MSDFDCQNPNCNNKGVVLYNRKILCGACLEKIQEIKRVKEEKEFSELIEATK